MSICCCNHRDLNLILNKGFTFIKENFDWFIHLFKDLRPPDKILKNRDIKSIRGHCYLTKLT